MRIDLDYIKKWMKISYDFMTGGKMKLFHEF